jgi:hypothetical protein
MPDTECGNEASQETALPIRKYQNSWRSARVWIKIQMGAEYKGIGKQRVYEAIDAFRSTPWV